MPMTIEFTGYDGPRRLSPVTRSAMMTTDGALRLKRPLERGDVA
jgi:hypothetical protein